ncbi:hypothetical protein GCM10010300_64150 [Streptomyces olivaceoviridis]|nr:hypothetical protein GCM10010300_64150 [Streptomyces olivaceoviridis]
MDATKTAKQQPTQCLHCGADVEQTPGVGRLRRYCTPAHGRAWRLRMRIAGWL